METICHYFLLFLFYSVCGWILEVICKLVSDKKFVNRGFLIGPYCPIYGWGALIMTLLLQKYLDDPITLFIMIILVCSILEYFTSYVMEKLFRTRWWDYSNYRFNINGRICLETMIPFGLFGFFIMYIVNPWILGVISQIPTTLLYIISILLFLIILIDTLTSFKIMSSLKIISSNIRTDSTERITKLVRKEIMEHNQLLQKRLIKAFPKLEILYSKGIERKKERQKKKEK